MEFEFHSRPPTVRERILLAHTLEARREYERAAKAPDDPKSFQIALGELLEEQLALFACRLVDPDQVEAMADLDCDDFSRVATAYDEAWNRAWRLATLGTETVAGGAAHEEEP